MPVTFRTPSETGGVIVKEILVSDDDPKTNASRRGKFAIKIRILPRKKRRPNVSQNLPEVEPPHYHHHQQPRQHGRQPKRTRFSCCSAADDDNEQLQHYDVAVADDVTYWSAAATASCISYSSCDLDSSQLRGWNVEEDTDSDDGRRRRTARHSGSGCQHDVPKPAGEEYSDEVFEDVTESGAAWRDVRHHREALRSMNVGSASDQRRQRVSQPPPPRHRPGGPRPAAPNAGADQGQTGRRPAPLRRALTDLEAAEVAAGYPEVYYVGDAATVNAEEPVRQHSAAKKTQDSGSATRADDSKTYDDEDGYYIHVPHDQIAYRYEVFKVLGRGSFGQVVRAFDHKTRSWVALKIVRSEERFRRQALDEVRMLSLLSRADSDGRSHVVRMVDHFEFRRHPCIVFEPLGVDLYEALKRRGYRGFPLTAARRAAYGIARCLQLLSRHGIIHCDLKPENVLLTVPPPHQRRSAYSGNNINVKVIDFGSSCYETDQLYVYVQSRFYRAPEVILGARYGTPVDMWSLGCIVAELITGRPLFAGDDETDQLTSQLEYLGMPPARLLARSRRAAEFFSTTTNLPRYCSVTKKSADDDEDNDDDSGLPSLTGSLNKSGTYRCPPGDKDLDAALLNIIGREPGAMDRRHRDYIEFVRQCVEWEPSARMTPEEALLHPWMQHDPTTQTRIVQPPPRHRSLAQARRGRPAGHADENDYL